MEYLLIAIFVVLFGVMGYYQIKFYSHYLGEHICATQDYFNDLDMDLIDIGFPQRWDWKNNPFEEEPLSLFGALFNFGFLPALISYRIVEVSEKNSTHRRIFWRQVSSQMFTNEITFLEQVTPQPNESMVDTSSHIVEVLDACPACNTKVNTNATQCSNCRLHFL